MKIYIKILLLLIFVSSCNNIHKQKDDIKDNDLEISVQENIIEIDTTPLTAER